MTNVHDLLFSHPTSAEHQELLFQLYTGDKTCSLVNNQQVTKNKIIYMKYRPIKKNLQMELLK